jgi:acyl carrier protein
MGFDTVELVMAIEEEFGVKIPDADAERMSSVGDVASYVFEQLQRLGRTDIDADSVIERVRAVTVAQLGVDPDVVFPWTRFVEDLGAD